MMQFFGLFAYLLFASADAQESYVSDSNTLFLFHFEESEGDIESTAESMILDDIYGTYSAESAPGYGNAFDFRAPDGSDDGRAAMTGATDSTDFSGPDGEFTMEALVNVPSANFPMPNTEQVLMSKDGGSFRGFIFQFINGGLEFFNGVSAVDSITIPTTGAHAFVADVWFHVAVTYNGVDNTADNMKFYWTRLDSGDTAANEIGSSTHSDLLSESSNMFFIGGHARSPYRYCFAGYMDEVRISDVARTASDFMFENSCSCTDGTVASGADCEVDGAEDCTSCDTGYFLNGQVCEENSCSCTDGTVASGAECEVNGAQDCTSCDTGYFLNGQVCEEMTGIIIHGSGGLHFDQASASVSLTVNDNGGISINGLGFFEYFQKYHAISCPANSIGDNLAFGCICDSDNGYSGSVSISPNAPFYTSTCT